MHSVVSGAAAPPSSHEPRLPRAFDQVVLRALDRDPQARFASVGDLAGESVPSADGTLTDAAEPRGEQTSEIRAPQLFVALECARASAGSTRHSLANLDRVLIGRGLSRSCERVFADGAPMLAVRIPDPRISLLHTRLVREGSGFVVEDADSRNGTRVNGARVLAPVSLADGDLIEVGHAILRYRASVTLPMRAPADVDSAEPRPGELLATVDPGLAHRIAMLARVAKSGAPVLVRGESGTGKEVLARAIHRVSQRRGAFVGVNCR
jgi:hypothetical protein